MPNYLIAVAIGPVQGFIAAARKTRDLWFGSLVLSEVSKAAARALHEQKATLIFPAPKSSAELEPDSPLNVANKLLARITTDNPKAVLEQAKQAARDRWKELAEDARRDLQKRGGQSVHQDIWKKQIDDVLEIFGAWVNLEQGYSKARERVDSLLAARKMTRDFHVAAKSFDEPPYFGLPKSSLDAARETVLQEDISTRTRRKLGLGKNEQLDCPGVVKRLGGDTEHFPPVTRIALETWLHEIPADNKDLQEIWRNYEVLVQEDVATRVKPARYNKLPYDGALLFPDRIAAERRELGEDEVGALNALKDLEKARTALRKIYGEPQSYYAVLVADGDKMGAYLDSCKDADAHRKVSQALDSFAGSVREIIETPEYRGACVYSGGDDVFALLPVDTAVACASALYRKFESAMSDLAPAKDGSRPTLSVGLGLAHAMTPFSIALDVGRRAEKLAKNGPEGTDDKDKRNALAIIVDVRSGAEISIRGQWHKGIVQRLQSWQKYYRDKALPATAPYDLQEAARRVEWAHAKGKDYHKTVAAQEIGRVLRKKRAKAGTEEISRDVVAAVEGAINKHGLEPVLKELRVARWLAAKNKE